jgi:hypothetical protein
MSGSIEYGNCACCGKEAQLYRTYYHYDVVCNCCVGDHFCYIAHCKDCEPKTPTKIKVTIDGVEPVAISRPF